MRLLTSAICTTVAVGLLAGCSGSNLGSTNAVPSAGAAQSHFTNGKYVPQFSKLASLIPAELRPAGAHGIAKLQLQPDKHKKKKSMIYASEFYGTTAFGYKSPNASNGPPVCTISGVSYINNIDSDLKSNVIDPDGGSRTVIVHKPKCGAVIGTISDGYGQPSDASSLNAATGKIAVGNIFDNSGNGSISVCTISGGCTTNLTNANMYEVAGVAMAKNGDCWGDAITSAGTATLTYFKGCSGSGQAATGFSNAYFGGLDIDKAGNLVTISAFDSKLYIYKGCNPGCTLVGGPFTLNGEAVFGHLNSTSTTLVTGDFSIGQLDVYKYSPSGISLQYSITNGLSSSLDVEGAAFAPASKQ
jgi:hypothetical protein